MQRRLIRSAVVIGTLVLLVATVAIIADPRDESSAPADASEAAAPQAGGNPSAAGGGAGLDGLVDIGGGRELYVRCTGTGSPTIVVEGGDDDTSGSYGYAGADLAEATRTCVYDAPTSGRVGRRRDREESTISSAISSACRTPPPTSSSARPAAATSRRATPSRIGARLRGWCSSTPLPRSRTRRGRSSRETDPDHPASVERRDFLQVERDA